MTKVKCMECEDDICTYKKNGIMDSPIVYQFVKMMDRWYMELTDQQRKQLESASLADLQEIWHKKMRVYKFSTDIELLVEIAILSAFLLNHHLNSTRQDLKERLVTVEDGCRNQNRVKNKNESMFEHFIKLFGFG